MHMDDTTTNIISYRKIKLGKFTTAWEEHLKSKNVEHRMNTLCRIECKDRFADEGYISHYKGIVADVDSATQASINTSK